jgi:hypothetical protein
MLMLVEGAVAMVCIAVRRAEIMGKMIQEQIVRDTIGDQTRIASTDLDRPLELQEVEAPIILRQSAREGYKVVSPIHRPPLPTRTYPRYSFLLNAKSIPGP